MIIKPENVEELVTLLKTKPLILYGMGDTGARIAAWCDEQGIEYRVSDKDRSKEKVYKEKYVVPSDIVKRHADAHVVVSSFVYSDEISMDLVALGVKKEQILQSSLFMPKEVTWELLEDNGRADFEMMNQRTQLLAKWNWIPKEIKSVADYGCGHRFMEKLIPNGAVYYPIDYMDRGSDTIICDFNKQEYPNVETDLSVCLGVLLYIEPARNLIEHICSHTKERIVFSFVAWEDFPRIDARRKSGVIQDYSRKDIIDMFGEYGFKMKDKRELLDGSAGITFFLFDRAEIKEFGS